MYVPHAPISTIWSHACSLLNEVLCCLYELNCLHSFPHVQVVTPLSLQAESLHLASCPSENSIHSQLPTTYGGSILYLQPYKEPCRDNKCLISYGVISPRRILLRISPVV